MDLFTEEEISSYLFAKIFNDDNYEVFPQLKECFDDNPIVMDNIFNDFVTDLYDLSKPVVRPFSDERSTYIYRKAHGILDDGVLQTKTSIGKEYNMTGARISQLIRFSNRSIINMLVVNYNSYKNGNTLDDIAIDELGLSNRVYFFLKRNGINFVSDIDMNKLLSTNKFGEKSREEVERGITRVRNMNSSK